TETRMRQARSRRTDPRAEPAASNLPRAKSLSPTHDVLFEKRLLLLGRLAQRPSLAGNPLAGSVRRQTTSTAAASDSPETRTGGRAASNRCCCGPAQTPRPL